MDKSTDTKGKKYKNFQRNLQRKGRYLYLRFLRLRGSPEELARGLAAGVFTGLFPVFGLQIAAGVLLAILMRGNKILAAAGTWISNPLTSLPLYILNYHVGRWLLGSTKNIEINNLNSWQDITQLGSEFMTELLLGCFFMGGVCAVFSYFLCLWLVRRHRKQKRSHQLI